uniref:Uncharacterized protein n=1 Tax=Sphaerodactylus townsendi TaxID=933632 RepID=A0ACB8EUA2_9SAUR
MRPAIPMVMRVAMALWYLASANSYREVAQQFGVGLATVADSVLEFSMAVEVHLYSRLVCCQRPMDQAEEVTILLCTIRDRGHALLLMVSMGLPNKRAYRAVARALQQAGFHRNEVQACTKWKALKRDFFAAMEASGGHP